MALVASPPRLLWALSKPSPHRILNTNRISKKIRLSVHMETMQLQSNMPSLMRYRRLWISWLLSISEHLWAYHDVPEANPRWDEPIRITFSERLGDGWFNATSAFGCIQCGVNGCALMLQLRAFGGKHIGLLGGFFKRSTQKIQWNTHYHNVWFNIQDLNCVRQCT